MKGFTERLKKGIESVVKDRLPVNLVAPPERDISHWIGLSIVGSMTCYDYGLTLRDYDEHGPSMIQKMFLTL